jgi:ketol-acid reductoisomerase
MRVYYDRDADVNLIKGKKVAIIGYGSQGHAHANNLKDSGVQTACRRAAPGSAGVAKAETAGLKVMDPADCAKWADVVMVLTPDEGQGDLYRDKLGPNMKPGAALAFAHGLNVHFNLLDPRPDIDVFMIAPKGPGHTVRSEYQRGGGVPCLVAVAQNPSGNALEVALSYASADRRRPRRHHRNHLQGGVRDRSVRRADRAVRRLGRADEGRLRDTGGRRLRSRNGLFRVRARGQADRRPDLRRRHRQHELLGQQHRRIRRVRLRPAHRHDATKAEMKRVLDDIQSGRFARDWMLENKVNQANFRAMRRRMGEHPIEQVGERLRAMMPWIAKNALVDKTKN